MKEFEDCTDLIKSGVRVDLVKGSKHIAYFDWSYGSFRNTEGDNVVCNWEDILCIYELEVEGWKLIYKKLEKRKTWVLKNKTFKIFRDNVLTTIIDSGNTEIIGRYPFDKRIKRFYPSEYYEFVNEGNILDVFIGYDEREYIEEKLKFSERFK